MECLCVFILFISLCVLVPSTVSGPAGGESSRGTQKNLSDLDHHTDNGEHNVKFDHEAFLGKEEAKTFSELSPEEAKRRLGIIVEKIDVNRDDTITLDELTDWIRQVSRRYVFDDRDRYWDFHIKGDSDHLKFEDYIEKSFGMIEDHNKIHDVRRNLTFAEVIARYEKRFEAADRDGNKLMDKDEFADFLHPHDVPWMRSVSVDEAFKDMDQNRDGEITLAEYIHDIQFSYDEEDNSWRERETKYFKTQRDKNGDGVLDREEIELWLYPPNTDPCVNEAKHLIYHADIDKNKVLSRSEILDHQDLFVGSQATEHGKFFVRHDEF